MSAPPNVLLNPDTAARVPGWSRSARLILAPPGRGREGCCVLLCVCGCQCVLYRAAWDCILRDRLEREAPEQSQIDEGPAGWWPASLGPHLPSTYHVSTGSLPRWLIKHSDDALESCVFLIMQSRTVHIEIEKAFLLEAHPARCSIEYHGLGGTIRSSAATRPTDTNF